VANVQQRLQHPETLDIDGYVGACALIHSLPSCRSCTAIAQRGSTPESVCCRVVR
jgi:hypothetical protein